MILKALQKNNACWRNSGVKFDQYAAVWTLRLLRGKLTCEVVSWPPGTMRPSCAGRQASTRRWMENPKSATAFGRKGFVEDQTGTILCGIFSFNGPAKPNSVASLPYLTSL
jgi:hypothetical protein